MIWDWRSVEPRGLVKPRAVVDGCKNQLNPSDISILTSPSFNDNNHVQLQSFQTIALDPANVDVLFADEEAVSAWQNFSRVSAPVFNHTVRARQGRLRDLSVSHTKSILYGTFVWGCRGA